MVREIKLPGWGGGKGRSEIQQHPALAIRGVKGPVQKISRKTDIGKKRRKTFFSFFPFSLSRRFSGPSSPLLLCSFLLRHCKRRRWDQEALTSPSPGIAFPFSSSFLPGIYSGKEEGVRGRALKTRERRGEALVTHKKAERRRRSRGGIQTETKKIVFSRGEMIFCGLVFCAK